MISIIIPTYDEGTKVATTITNLLGSTDDENISEIIIADGGSIDNTVEIAKNLFAKIIIVGEKKGRHN